MNKPIFLLGFMGSGKTSIGKKLARKLALDFIDLDTYIEEKYSSSITSIFAEKGEEQFRLIEQTCLKELSEKQDCVISLGGGTPCYFDNMQLIKQSGTSIYLKLEVNILVGRLRLKKAKRPLIANKNDEQISQFVHQELTKREAYYKQADFVLVNNHPKAQLIVDLLQ